MVENYLFMNGKRFKASGHYPVVYVYLSFSSDRHSFSADITDRPTVGRRVFEAAFGHREMKIMLYCYNVILKKHSSLARQICFSILWKPSEIFNSHALATSEVFIMN